MIPNYYKQLGLTPDSTKEEIKKAYRKLALKYHPDKNNSPDAHETFIEINEAYLILSNEEARAKYDREYNSFYKEKEYQRDSNKQPYSKTRYTYQRSKFEDDNLNNWAKNAREQAESFAKMAFKEFSKLVFGIVKETGFQILNAVIGIIGGFLFIAGINDTFVFLFTGMKKGTPLAIILAIVGYLIIRFVYLRQRKHEVK